MELRSSSDLEVTIGKLSAHLDFAKIQEQNEGNYTCKVSNSFGSDSFTAKLEVEGALINLVVKHN